MQIGSVCSIWQQNRAEQTAGHSPQHSCPSPGHAFQKSAPVQTVMLEILQNNFCFHLIFNFLGLFFSDSLRALFNGEQVLEAMSLWTSFIKMRSLRKEK